MYVIVSAGAQGVDVAAEFCGGHDVGFFYEFGYRELGIEGVFCFAGGALFGGDEDDAAGGAGSVDGGGGRVLQDGEGFYFRGVDEAQGVVVAIDIISAEGQSVDHDEGIVAGVQGGYAADADDRPGARGAAVGYDGYAGDLAGDQL